MVVRAYFRISGGGGWLSVGVFVLPEIVRFMAVSCSLHFFSRGDGFAVFRHLPVLDLVMRR